MKNYEMDLSDLEEMEPVESPTCIIGPWFFVHKQEGGSTYEKL